MTSRSSLYILGVKILELQQAGLTEAEFCQLEQATMDKLIGQPVVLLDDVLLEEATPWCRST